MARSTYHVRHPRYRGPGRRSARLEAFLAAMVTKFNLQDTPLTPSAVGNPSNTIDLPSTPTTAGPFVLRGAVPTELRDFFDQLGDSGKQFWLRVGTNDVSTIHYSAKDAAATPVHNFVDGDVSVANDTITDVGHGMSTGTGPVTLTNTGGALPTGLAAATNYWVIAVDNDTYKLANSLANALAGTAVNITAAAGGGVHSLVRSGIRGIQLALWQNFTFVDGDVTVGTDAIAETGHGMLTGHGPVRLTTTGVLPAGLAAATDYWVIRVDDNNFKLATTRALALAGTAVDITAAAGGGTHTLDRNIKLYRALSSKDAIMRWLAQGVDPQTMLRGAAGDAGTIFV